MSFQCLRLWPQVVMAPRTSGKRPLYPIACPMSWAGVQARTLPTQNPRTLTPMGEAVENPDQLFSILSKHPLSHSRDTREWSAGASGLTTSFASLQVGTGTDRVNFMDPKLTLNGTHFQRPIVPWNQSFSYNLIENNVSQFIRLLLRPSKLVLVDYSDHNKRLTSFSSKGVKRTFLNNLH